MILGGGVRRAAGWLLLLIPLIPLRGIFDDPPGTTWLPTFYEWTMGLFIFGSLAWLASRLFPEFVERLTGAVSRTLSDPSPRVFRVGILALLGVLLTAASLVAFSQSPLLIDSIIQLFQGKIFAGGDAWVPAPELESFFTTQHMVSDAGRWYSQYPPGHPAAMAVGVWIGLPWLIPIVLTLLSAWLMIDTAGRLFGEPVARVTGVLLVLASFFWFMGASYMNHVTSLFFISLFFWCFVRWAGGDTSEVDTPAGHGVWILLAGLALGAAFVTRPLTAVAVGAALTIPALRIAGRGWWSAALLGAAGFFLVGSLYFVFNAATTGDALTAGYMRLWGESHGLGFHASPWGDAHTPLTGLRNELIDLGLLHGFLFEWPIPALFPLGVMLVAGWSTRAWEGRMLGAFFAIPAAYFFYWHRDAFLGPRYLYEGFPFFLPLLALAFVTLRERLRDREINWLGINAGTFFAAIVGFSFLYSLGFGVPQRFRIYATGMASVKQDLLAEAHAAGIEEGLVFVKVSWGNRLIARARGAGASASLVESVYRRSDHCELEQVVVAAEAEGWTPDRLEQEILSVMRPEDEVEMVRINEDPTLRLVPGQSLADPCIRELVYDRDGLEEMPVPPTYTNYSPHLASNAPDLEGPIVFARDLREQNARLRAMYPDMPAFLYRDGAFVPLP